MKTLTKILELYQKKFIQPNIIDGIRQRELNNDFPFSVHNMMRTFLNLAPYFFQGFYKYYEDHKLHNIGIKLIHKKFGSVTRVYRYTLFLIIGAWLEKNISWRKKLDFLNYLARVLDYKMNHDLVLPHSELKYLRKLISKNNNDKISNLELSSLAIHLKECVDFMFLGEHPIGYTTYPPSRLGKKIFVVRKFYNLDYQNLLTNLKTVTIAETYDAKLAAAISFDIFRGNLYGLPNYQQRIHGMVLVNNRPTTDALLIKKIINHINRALKKRAQYYQQRTSADLEVEQALIYATELRLMFNGNLPAALEKDIKEAVYTNKIGAGLLKKNEVTTYTEAYFRTLSNAVTEIKKILTKKI